MAEELVTLDQAKAHLGLNGTTEHDENLEMKIEEATELCLDYLKNYVGDEEDRDARYAEIDAYTDETMPKQLRSAILRMVAHLHRFRGDDDRNTAPVLENGDLPKDVTMFLNRLRDPALA